MSKMCHSASKLLKVYVNLSLFSGMCYPKDQMHNGMILAYGFMLPNP